MKVALIACLATGLFALPAMASDAPQTPAGYIATGQKASCLSLNRIDTTRIINESQILVEMRNGDVWLQQPRNCSKLRKHYALSYDAFGNQLCDTTAVTLLDTGSTLNFAGVCMFDQFQKLTKQTAAAE